MQEKRDVSKSRILFILNNYSYFSHANITGPKSIIALIGSLIQHRFSIDVCIPNFIGTNFPHNVRLHKLSSLEIMKLTYQSDIIIVDRHFFVLGWVLSKLFRKKLCLRLLGLGTRLSSRRLLSKKNLIRVLTHISAVDLVISTLDASAAEHDIKFIRSHKLSPRMNGIQFNEEEKTQKRGYKKHSKYFQQLNYQISNLMFLAQLKCRRCTNI